MVATGPLRYRRAAPAILLLCWPACGVAPPPPRAAALPPIDPPAAPSVEASTPAPAAASAVEAAAAPSSEGGSALGSSLTCIASAYGPECMFGLEPCAAAVLADHDASAVAVHVDRVERFGKVTTSAIQSVYDDFMFQSCYHEARAGDPDLHGSLRVRLSLGSGNGCPHRVEILHSSLPSERARRCVMDVFKLLRLPDPSHNAAVFVTVTLGAPDAASGSH